MSQPDKIFELFREWLAATNPGLVTRDDLSQVESRLDDLMGMVDDIESRLDEIETGEAEEDEEEEAPEVFLDAGPDADDGDEMDGFIEAGADSDD